MNDNIIPITAADIRFSTATTEQAARGLAGLLNSLMAFIRRYVVITDDQAITLNDKDPMALGVAARIERRDVTGSSFWFAIDSPDDEEWEIDDPQKLPLRTLKKLRLIDVGPVSYPAYEATSTNVTRTDDAIAELEQCRKQIERAKAWREPQLTRPRSAFE